jgi:hypothetical protein
MNYPKNQSADPEIPCAAEPAVAYAARGKAVKEPWEVDSAYDDFYNGGAGDEDSEYDPYQNDDWVREWAKFCEENYPQSEEDKRINRLFQNDPKYREHCRRILADAQAAILAKNRNSSIEEVDAFWDKIERDIRQYDGV